MIRTSGQNTHFWAFGTGPSAENVDKSQEKCKNKALVKMTVVGPFFWDRGWPYRAKTGDRALLISHAVFIMF